MKITIDIADMDISRQVKDLINIKVGLAIEEIIKNSVPIKEDINKIVITKIESHIDRSKYVSHDIIRNFVQQKISREITEQTIKDILDKKK